MCGRFVSFRKAEELVQYFPIDETACDVIASYNIAPLQEIPVITQRDGRNILDRFHWGLVPAWAKDKSIGNSLINARSETLSTKPSFRTAFRRRRCLIPADGFYEWKAVPETGKKQPYFLRFRMKIRSHSPDCGRYGRVMMNQHINPAQSSPPIQAIRSNRSTIECR